MSTHVINPFSSPILNLIPSIFIFIFSKAFLSFYCLLTHFFFFLSSSKFGSMDSTNPYTETGNFVNLLTSQQGCVPPQAFRYDGFSHGGEVGSPQVPVYGEETPPEGRSRKKWGLTEDVVLISAWLNTSKDPVVGNEQRAGAFWKRIAAYFAASPKVQGGEKRESIQCKQRWQKINDLVSKFSGSYEAATRQKTSGMNENDVVKLAHEIFHNDHKLKFNLQHAWEELRFDQKWCEVASSKLDGSRQKRKCDNGAQSESSHATPNDGEPRPPGVKASKRGIGKRTNEDLKDVSEIKSLWAIKEKDLEVKERLSRMGLLETLIAKKEPLSDFEEALKTKLLSEMLGKLLNFLFGKFCFLLSVVLIVSVLCWFYCLCYSFALYQAAQCRSRCCSVSGGNTYRRVSTSLSFIVLFVLYCIVFFLWLLFIAEWSIVVFWSYVSRTWKSGCCFVVFLCQSLLCRCWFVVSRK